MHMKAKKFIVVAAMAFALAAMALVGCSSGGSASSASASGSASASASASESASASAAADFTLVTPGQLTFATSPDYPPFENDENGEFVGYDIDLAKAVAEKLGLEAKFQPLDFDGIIAAISSGGQADVGISGISVTPERAQEIDFTEAYYEDNQGVAVMKTSGITEESAVKDLNKKEITIAVQSGTTGEAYAQETFPNATVKAYKNSTDCFADMQAGNVQAVCTNLVVVERMLKSAYTDAQVVHKDATGEKYAMAVSKSNPALTEAINKALAELQADGTIDKLAEKHL